MVAILLLVSCGGKSEVKGSWYEQAEPCQGGARLEFIGQPSGRGVGPGAAYCGSTADAGVVHGRFSAWSDSGDVWLDGVWDGGALVHIQELAEGGQVVLEVSCTSPGVDCSGAAKWWSSDGEKVDELAIELAAVDREQWTPSLESGSLEWFPLEKVAGLSLEYEARKNRLSIGDLPVTGSGCTPKPVSDARVFSLSEGNEGFNEWVEAMSEAGLAPLNKEPVPPGAVRVVMKPTRWSYGYVAADEGMAWSQLETAVQHAYASGVLLSGLVYSSKGLSLAYGPGGDLKMGELSAVPLLPADWEAADQRWRNGGVLSQMQRSPGRTWTPEPVTVKSGATWGEVVERIPPALTGCESDSLRRVVVSELRPAFD